MTQNWTEFSGPQIRLLRVAGSRQEEEALCVEEEQVAAVRRENKRE